MTKNKQLTNYGWYQVDVYSFDPETESAAERNQKTWQIQTDHKLCHITKEYKLLCPRGTQTCALAVANIAHAVREMLDVAKRPIPQG